MQTIVIAPTDSFNGYIAEVLIYNHELSSADHDAVHSYLSTKWGISLKSDGGG